MSLITVQEFANNRNVSKKLDEGKIEECIDLAEGSDLYDILGDFYFDIVKNQNETDYADLMAGSSFEYCGEEFTHKGIKKLLSDYVYSRYVYVGNINDTAFGMVAKTYQDGTPTERNTLKDLAKQAQVDAGFKFQIIEKYILSKPDTFSRYCGNQKVKTGFNSQKFSKL